MTTDYKPNMRTVIEDDKPPGNRQLLLAVYRENPVMISMESDATDRDYIEAISCILGNIISDPTFSMRQREVAVELMTALRFPEIDSAIASLTDKDRLLYEAWEERDKLKEELHNARACADQIQNSGGASNEPSR